MPHPIEKTAKWFARLWHARVVRFVCVGVLLFGVGVGYYLWTQRPILDKNVVAEADFTVYAPKKTPAGFVLRQEQTQLSGDTLSYVFREEVGDREITVTVQPTPPNFDMQQIISGGSIKSTETPTGTLYNLSVAGVTKYLIDAGDTLIFITSPTAIDTATINALAASIAKVR